MFPLQINMAIKQSMWFYSKHSSQLSLWAVVNMAPCDLNIPRHNILWLTHVTAACTDKGPGSTWQGKQGKTWPYWTEQGKTWPYWTEQDKTWPYWTEHSITWPNGSGQDKTWPNWTEHSITLAPSTWPYLQLDISHPHLPPCQHCSQHRWYTHTRQSTPYNYRLFKMWTIFMI